jgi:HKD family nuclease
MENSEAKVKSAFLSRFKLDDRLLQKGVVKSGRASMVGAVDRVTGNRVIIKQWRRNTGIAGVELHELWRQELRHLHRLAGYPGARQYIVPLLDSSEEDESFFLALGSGQRLPLQVVIDDASDNHWLKQPRSDANRMTIWSNLYRIACGLNLLHMQGLLHRNLDAWAIYTSGDDSPDFQLTGFEWSIRLSSNMRNSPLSTSAIADMKYVHSFLQDWHAFGVLATGLFGLEAKALLGRKGGDGRDVAYFLTGMERDLLLLLLRADPFSRIDGETVQTKISAIVESLQTIITKRDERLYLTPKLGLDSELSKAIRTASGRKIEIADIPAQIEFIKNDVSENPQFVFSTTFAGAGHSHHFLYGRELNYRLTPYRHVSNGRRGDPNWGIAYCEASAEKRPAGSDIVAYKALSGHPIEVLSSSEISKRFVTLQGRTSSWDRLLDLAEGNVSNSADLRQYRALLLVQVLESLLIASEIWPVQIFSYEETSHSDSYKLKLKYRKDEEREKLASALKLRPTAQRMHEAFGADQWQTEEEWRLTDIGVLGAREGEKSDWTFVDAVEVPEHGTIYEFEGKGIRQDQIISTLLDEDEECKHVDAVPGRYGEKYAILSVVGSVIEGLPNSASPKLRRIILAAVSHLQTPSVELPQEKVKQDVSEESVLRIKFDSRDFIVGGKEHEELLKYSLKKARSRILIHSTFISVERFRAIVPLLHDAAKRGVRIDILWGKSDVGTDNESMQKIVAQCKALFLGDDVRERITVHSFSTNSHAKILVFDNEKGRTIAVLGSCNWLYSGFTSTEASVRLEDPVIVSQIVAHLGKMAAGPGSDWTSLATDLALLATSLKKLPSGSRGIGVDARLVFGSEHSHFVRKARDEAKHRIVLASHRFSQNAETLVLRPTKAAIKANDIDVKLYYGQFDGEGEGAVAKAIAENAKSDGVRHEQIRDPSLHAKVLAWDANSVVVSSQNWLSADPPDNAPYSEIGLYLSGANLANELVHLLQGKMPSA